MVADASALDWLKVGHTQGSVRVITPHPGEAARMLGATVVAVQSDRLAAARALSEKYGGCIVVLKGHQTLVGSTGQGWSINSTGNPYLAQGGAGDLLAGWLAGWLAQPAVARQALLAARYAVWKHGTAADEWQLGGRRWTLDDLVKLLV
jgi:NAD(P)H-hydrate epimerase